MALAKTSLKRRLSTVSLRTIGVVGIFEEAIFQHGERPTLLLIFASMLGLPTFLQVDKTANGKAPAEQPKESSSAGAKP